MHTKTVVMIVFQCLSLLAAVFLPAGTIYWPAGWLFVACLFGFTVAVLHLTLTTQSGLLEERTQLRHADQKAWDRIYPTLFGIVSLAWLIMAPLDAVRFGWSAVPLWLQAAGLVGLVLSLYIIYLTFRENAFLSHVVRIQEERGHTVISTGPYAYVRHPMYAGVILMFFTAALLLGSWVSVGISAVLTVLFAIRARREEETLREELAGYDAYMNHVQARFIPYLW